MADTRRDKLHAKQKRGLAKYDWRWMSSWPKWWDKLYHTRPSRRKEKALLHDALRGDDPVDWPDGRKPHKYYW